MVDRVVDRVGTRPAEERTTGVRLTGTVLRRFVEFRWDALV
ncbi:MAG: hypothetical protein AAF736_09765 [Pseudomonadota bacterium]